MSGASEWLLPVDWMRARDEAFRELFAFDTWLASFDEAEVVPVFFDLRWAALEDHMDTEGSIAELVETTVVSDLGEGFSPENELGSEPGEESGPGYGELIERIHGHAEDLLRVHAEKGELLDGPTLRRLVRDQVVEVWTQERGLT